MDRFAPEQIKERWASLLYDSSLAQYAIHLRSIVSVSVLPCFDLYRDTAARIDELDFDLPLPSTSRPHLPSTDSQPSQASASAVSGVVLSFVKSTWPSRRSLISFISQNAEEGASVPQADSKPAQIDAQSGSSRAFLGSELDFLPFSIMEQTLLKDMMANRPMDFFARIARKEGTSVRTENVKFNMNLTFSWPQLTTTRRSACVSRSSSWRRSSDG